MRLQLDKIKRGLLHPEIDARFFALSHFTESFSRDPEIMPLVIQAFEKYSLAGAFVHFVGAAHLVQTEATVGWMVDAYRRNVSGEEVRDRLLRVLTAADPRLLLPFEAELRAVKTDTEGYHEKIAEVLEFTTWNADQCWAELERIVKIGDDHYGAWKFPFARGQRVVLALSQLPAPGIDRVLAELAAISPKEEFSWMECYLVQLAGDLRLGEAIPSLVKRLHQEYNEPLFADVHQALTKIGTDEVVQAIGNDYAHAGQDFRSFGADCLNNIRGDACEKMAFELLEVEEDTSIRTVLAWSLLLNFSEQGLEKVRQMILNDDHDPGFLSLEEELVSAAKVMGTTFPEFDKWDAEVKAQQLERERRNKRQVHPVSPVPKPKPSPAPRPPTINLPPRPAAHVGRNDKCPCGSGKKFKSCCLNKRG